MEEQIRLAFRSADKIIEYRMEDDAFKTQYYVSHGNRVSELAEQAAIELGADPLVCKLAGKFHDIGYSSNSENSKEQHIKKGVKITRDVLSGLMMPIDYVDRVVSCVQTHDDSFDEVPSIENLIVNDVDVLVFFDSLKENIALIVKAWKKTPEDAVKSLKDYAEIKENYVQLDVYKPETSAKKQAFLKELSELESKGMEWVQSVADRKYAAFVEEYKQKKAS